jgi:hypothetical protein
MMTAQTATPMSNAETVCKLLGVNYDQIIWHSHIVPTFPITRILQDAVDANRFTPLKATRIAQAFIDDGWDVWNMPT